MSLGQFTRRFARHSPALRGAAFAVGFALALTACGKRGGTTAWTASAEPAASGLASPAAPAVGPRVSRLAPPPAVLSAPPPPPLGWGPVLAAADQTLYYIKGEAGEHTLAASLAARFKNSTEQLAAA